MKLTNGLRAALSLVLSLTLLSCVSAPTGETQKAQSKPLQPDYTYWPHDVSDLKPDSGVKYGVLPNGLRYAIMRNVQPAGAVSVKLRIAAGSLQESDAQRGLAHFLEHMAFNGSKNIPEGEYVKLLQRKGLAFGAHTNAYTSFDETVYMLELPKNTDDLLDTALMLFREVGGNLSLDQKAIDREKGVVLSEMRTRNTPEYRAFENRWKLWHEGQRHADRFPIGTKETLEGATRELIAEYYTRNYRPERSLVVVVGDIDPANVEKLIAAKFADWKGVGEDAPDPDLGTPKQRTLTVKSYNEPNLPEDVTVASFQPGNYETDTSAARIRDARWWMAVAIINRRLNKLARGDDPPFVSAEVSRAERRGVSNVFTYSADTKPGGWKRGLTAVEQEVRRALQHGFSKKEIERELKEWRASLEDDAGSASTRKSSALASSIVSGFSDRSVFTHPIDDLAIFEKYAPTLTPESVHQGLKEVAEGTGPIVFLTSGTPVAGGDQAVADTFTASSAVAVAANTENDAKTFPYTNFGAPGSVVSDKLVDDIDTTLLTFDNGVRVNFKRTAFEKETVNVLVRFDGGFVALPPNKIGMYWAVPFSFTEGGLKKLTSEELEESLAGKVVGMDLDLDEGTFEFSARSSERDFALQMQLFAAFATEPAYRNQGLERLKASAESSIKQYASSPGRVLSREASSLIRSGDKRWVFPKLEQLQAITMKDVEQAIAPSLQHAPVEITVVGDIAKEDVIKAVAATFGALPKRQAKLDERPDARNVSFPKKAMTLAFTHEGASDQTAAYVAWAAPDFYTNPKRARTITLLREIIQVRLTEEFREVQGATYSPSVSSAYSTTFPGFGYLVASAETKPEFTEGFFKTLDKVVAEIAAGNLPDDVVERARTPMVKSIEKNRQTNGYWLGAIDQIQSEPRGLEAIRSQLPHAQGITKQEVIQVARELLTKSRRLDVRVFPEKRAKSSLLPPDTTLSRGARRLKAA